MELIKNKSGGGKFSNLFSKKSNSYSLVLNKDVKKSSKKTSVDSNKYYNILFNTRKRKSTRKGSKSPFYSKSSKALHMNITTKEMITIKESDGTYIGYINNNSNSNNNSNKKNGYGTKKFNNHNVYEGNWKDDKIQGNGKMIYSNGNVYEGNWKDNEMDGNGKMIYSNGNVYEGNWKNNKKNGQGIMIYTNNDKYEGDWNNDKMDGKGKMIYKNGDIYEGKWNKDKKYGKFTITKNSIATSQVFHNNKEFTSNRITSKFQKYIRDLSPETRRGMYLSTICGNNFGECLSVGNENNKINEFFNNFTDFEYLNIYYNNEKPKPITDSNNINGIIYQLEYTKKDELDHIYNVYTILKTEIQSYSHFNNKSHKWIIKNPDSLLYEYYVGLFLNQYTKIFPCFCETYGIYKSDSKKTDLFTTITNIKKNLKLIDLDSTKINENFKNYGCKNKEINIHILIQYINNPKTFNSIHDYIINGNLNFTGLLPILYQIYLPLSILGNSFTHYDLHGNNILLQRLNNNNFIKFNYHISSTEIISFNTYYLVKIIDYGRCYFELDNDINTKKINTELTELRKIRKPSIKSSAELNIYECPSTSVLINNESNLTADFKIFKDFKTFNYKGIPEYFKILLKELYSKIEKMSDLTVIKMADFLGNIIKNNETFKKENENKNIYINQIGILDVYTDNKTPMKYTPTPKK